MYNRCLRVKVWGYTCLYMLDSRLPTKTSMLTTTGSNPSGSWAFGVGPFSFFFTTSERLHKKWTHHKVRKLLYFKGIEIFQVRFYEVLMTEKQTWVHPTIEKRSQSRMFSTTHEKKKWTKTIKIGRQPHIFSCCIFFFSLCLRWQNMFCIPERITTD